MEIQASAKYLRISPRKVRLLTRGIKGMAPAAALVKLQSYPQKGATFLQKVVKQAMANAVNNFKLAQNDLKIKNIQIGEGPVFKRMDRSHGARFDRGVIKKRTAHIYLTLEAVEKAEEKKATKEQVDKEVKKVEQVSSIEEKTEVKQEAKPEVEEGKKTVKKVNKGAKSKTKEE